MAEPINELTLVARLGTTTGVRAAERRAAGLRVLIEAGEVEERQLDPDTGRYRRYDIRLNGPGDRKLASGEMKRPEVPEGCDVESEVLIRDARRKAVTSPARRNGETRGELLLESSVEPSAARKKARQVREFIARADALRYIPLEEELDQIVAAIVGSGSAKGRQDPPRLRRR